MRVAPGEIVHLKLEGVAVEASSARILLPYPTELGGVSVTLKQHPNANPIPLPILTATQNTTCMAPLHRLPPFDPADDVKCESEPTLSLTVQIPFELKANGPGHPMPGEGPGFDAVLTVNQKSRRARACEWFPWWIGFTS